MVDGGTLDLDNGGVALDLNGNATLSTTTLNGTGTLTKAGTGILTLGSNYATDLAVDGGTLRIPVGVTITGDTTVNSGGRLEVAGAVAGTVTVAGGTFAAGNSPGLGTVTNLDVQAGSTFEVELEGLLAGSEYDQVIVTGTTTLAGALNLLIDPGFTPPLLTPFTIIDGSTPIATMFDDGLTVAAGGFSFDVADAGGDGFDVVLTRVPEPASLGLMAMALAMVARRRRHA